MPVQRSNGSNVAAWMTRVPPATGSSRQLHSLSKPDAGHPQAEARLGPRLEALDPGLLAQQAEPRRGRCGSSRRPARPAPPGRGAAPGTAPPTTAGSWSVAQTIARRGLDEDAALDAAVRRPVVAGASVADLGVGADRHRSDRRSGARPSSSRGRRRSIRDARRRGRRASRSGPRRPSSGGAARRLMSSAASSSVSVRRSSGTPQVSMRVDVDVAGQDRHELGLAPGQDVDDAARHVGGGEHLGQRHRRQRPRLGGEQRRPRCRVTSGGASRLTEPEQRRRLGRDDADDAGRLGDREVEVRRRDRVRRAEDLGDLVGPAGVPDPAVDGAVDDLAGACRRAAPRRPRPRRRTGRAGPPSARRRGRGPGRGSSRSWPAQPGRTPCARPGRRRAGPCATRGRRWRAACRPRR